MFVTKHLVMFILMYQPNTGHRASTLYNESNTQKKFTFKCWSCHAFNNLHQLSSFCALCFAIFADETSLLLFVLQTFSWNNSPIYFVCSPISSPETFRSICVTCVVKGILLDIGRNLWHSLVLQSQISNFPYSLKNLSPVWNYFHWRILHFHQTRRILFAFCCSFNVLLLSKNKKDYLIKYQMLFLL